MLLRTVFVSFFALALPSIAPTLAAQDRVSGDSREPRPARVAEDGADPSEARSELRLGGSPLDDPAYFPPITIPAAADPVPEVEVPQGQVNPAESFRIGPGDVLQISVWREPDVSVSGVAVRSDGKISLPLIKEVEVLGLTPSQVERDLTARFSRYINHPEVTVIVQEVHSQRIYVVGAVHSPGAVELRGPMTVLQVIAEVGGVTEFAKKKKIYVLREREGKQVRLPFDYASVLKGDGSGQNVQVESGDTVVVPE
jgi:polysaccharide export outer membrane protein